jgi:hypothetical protein
MKYALYNSIEEMIRPDTLSELEQKTFTATHLAPFQGHGASGSTFLTLHTANGHQATNRNSPRYVIKRVSREWDWIMHVTGDRYGRTATLWQHGILDRLPTEIEHVVVACSVDGTGRAILMRDVTETLLPSHTAISEKDHELILDAMAALHATFWEDPLLDHPELNLVTPEQIFHATSPEKVREMCRICPHPFLELVLEGWDLLPKYIEADIVELLHSLAHDPSPLCSALSRFPRTLVHHDMHPGNIGIIHGEQPHLVLLDWMHVVATVPTLDLARHLIDCPSGQDAAIDFYKLRLAQRLGDRFEESWWQAQLELSLLADFLVFACIKAWFATQTEDEERRIFNQASLAWYSEHARTWARWLS